MQKRDTNRSVDQPERILDAATRKRRLQKQIEAWIRTISKMTRTPILPGTKRRQSLRTLALMVQVATGKNEN